MQREYTSLKEWTVDEIAEETGLKRETVRWYGTPFGSRRGKRALVKMDDDEEDYA